MLEQIISQLAADITKTRQYCYSHDQLERFMRSYEHCSCRNVKITNKYNDLLDCILIHSGASQRDSCIIYAHGLGSNKLEAIPVAKTAANIGIDVFTFDFSGSGMSEGMYTSYGLREQDDINSVLAWLDTTRLYKRYILWGRSMGAAAVMLSQSTIAHPKVTSIVMDSSFSSFEAVALELASKKSYIPKFILELIVEPLKAHFASNYPFDPFKVKLTDHINKVKAVLLLVHSLKDSVISHDHTVHLAEACRTKPSQILIEEDHNTARSQNTLKKIFEFIDKTRNYLYESRRERKRGISLTTSERKNTDEMSPKLRRGRLSLTQNLNKKTPTKSYFNTSVSSVEFSENSRCSLISQRKPAINSFVLELQSKENRTNNAKIECTRKPFEQPMEPFFGSKISENSQNTTTSIAQLRKVIKHRNLHMQKI